MLRVLAASLALVCCGCGYMGEPLPPALNIPVGVRDLSAIERGPEILVRFTLPTQTTDGLRIKKFGEIELRVGPAQQPPFSLTNWIASAKVISGVPADRSALEYAFPAAEWIGREVVIGVRVTGASGRASDWSNLVTLTVVPPLEQPTALAATVSGEARYICPGPLRPGKFRFCALITIWSGRVETPGPALMQAPQLGSMTIAPAF